MGDLHQIKPDTTKVKTEKGSVEIPKINPEPPKLSQAKSASGRPKRRFRVKFPKLRIRSKKVEPSEIRLRRAKFSLGGIGVIILLLVFIIIFPALTLVRGGKKLYNSALTVKASVETQDINVVKAELQHFKEDLVKFQKSYSRLSFFKVVPFISNYYKDGEAGIKAGLHGIDAAEIAIETITPYADIIGFAGPNSKEAESGEQTANDRMEFIIQTIEGILPKMDDISVHANLAQAELDKINPSRYPKKLRGLELRDNLTNLISLATQGTEFIAKSKPLMAQVPYLLGIDGERTYLLLFQNDKELRATGGFITGYSIMKINEGKASPTISSDVYDLDQKYRPSIDAPQEFVDFIKGPYIPMPKFRLRDMNWSPDFQASMDTFTQEAQEAGINDIDGVIAVDTQVVVAFLDVIGQIGVPGFGNFNTDVDPRCNCPQVVYEIESFADVEGPVVWSENEPGKIVFAPPNYDNRKKIIGPLMNSVLANTMGQPKEKLPDLFQAAFDLVTQKHVLLYMFDEEVQHGLEEFGIAGRIVDTQGDYLHINDSNLGGRKSNLYVTQEVVQDIEVSRDGTITKTLQITYNNPKEHDGWLNSVLPNWTRVYVPKGSELIDVSGFETKKDPYEELGKTVFAGGFELRPQGVNRVSITYKLPFKVTDKNYSLLIQKQPGTFNPLYTINIKNTTDEFFLLTDKTFKFSF